MEFFVSLLFDIFNSLISLLPLSPFPIILALIEDDLEVLGYVNWFIPFDFCLTALEIWCAAVATYYIFKNINRIMDFFSKLPIKL